VLSFGSVRKDLDDLLGRDVIRDGMAMWTAKTAGDTTPADRDIRAT